jgi:hypothetical protein
MRAKFRRLPYGSHPKAGKGSRSVRLGLLQVSASLPWPFGIRLRRIHRRNKKGDRRRLRLRAVRMLELELTTNSVTG